ncbi:MAG: arginine deiminase family protein [Desulfobacterales bacterium]
MKLALTHEVSERITQCEVNFREREPIDVSLARRQHDAYCQWLAQAGCEVVKLNINPEFPDSVFVEDNAVVVDEVAVVTPMGVASRRGEVVCMAPVLAQYRPLTHLVDVGGPGATLEGGDVLQVGRKLWAGLSTRTNAVGVAALRQILATHGYEVIAVPLAGTLHLKSALGCLDDETLIINPEAISKEYFEGFKFIDVVPEEPRGANVLRIGERIAVYAGYSLTLQKLRQAGYDPTPIDVSELIKADSGMTCSSIIMNQLP